MVGFVILESFYPTGQALFVLAAFSGRFALGAVWPVASRFLDVWLRTALFAAERAELTTVFYKPIGTEPQGA